MDNFSQKPGSKSKLYKERLMGLGNQIVPKEESENEIIPVISISSSDSETESNTGNQFSSESEVESNMGSFSSESEMDTNTGSFSSESETETTGTQSSCVSFCGVDSHGNPRETEIELKLRERDVVESELRCLDAKLQSIRAKVKWLDLDIRADEAELDSEFVKIASAPW